jgi:hypothetical protein
VLYYRKQFADALAEASDEAPSFARQAFLVGIHFALGRKHESDALLADLTRNIDAIDAYWIATAYTMRGEKDKAFEWLDKGYARHELSLHTPGDPIFAPLRADPRWAMLVERLSD